jgi:hypothetical protein
LVDVCAAVVADEQSAALVEPGEGALDDPAITAEPGAMTGLASRDQRLDPTLPELTAVAVVVVATIGDEPIGPSARTPDTAAHPGDTIDERNQLGHVVAVATGKGPGQG